MTAARRAGAIAMLTSRVRSDERALFAAFASRGIDCLQIDTRRLTSDTAPAGIEIALDREIGLARATYAASLLESRGVRVFNPADAVRRCGDKWETTRALLEAGLPMPRTVLALTPEAALDAAEELGWPVVIKPLVGSWGRRIGSLPNRDTASLVLEHVAALPSPSSHVIYMQELIDDVEADVRLLVVGQRVVGACRRDGPGLRKNVALGSVTVRWSPDDDTQKLALAAAQAVGADIAGVDVLVSADHGPVVLEVNAGVEFSGLQVALGAEVDVAAAVVDHVLRQGAA